MLGKLSPKKGILMFGKKVIWMVTNSIKVRGLRRTLAAILSYLGDFAFDIRYGTDTVHRVNLANLDIKSPNKVRGCNYVPTRARPFKKLISALELPNNSVFVDFGSGMGRVLLIASQEDFRRVVGIEFSHALCETARKNLIIFRKQAKVVADVQILETDVSEYEIKGDENVFYLYHPFSEIVLSSVLRNITMSLEKKPRKIWIIYNNPIHHRIIASQGNFVKSEEFFLSGSQFNLYVNKLEQY